MFKIEAHSCSLEMEFAPLSRSGGTESRICETFYRSDIEHRHSMDWLSWFQETVTQNWPYSFYWVPKWLYSSCVEQRLNTLMHKFETVTHFGAVSQSLQFLWVYFARHSLKITLSIVTAWTDWADFRRHSFKN